MAMRTRSRSQPSVISNHVNHGQRFAAGEVVEELVSSRDSFGPSLTETMSDENHPGYHRASAYGQIFNSDMQKIAVLNRYPQATSYFREMFNLDDEGKVVGVRWNGTFPMEIDSLGPYLDMTCFPDYLVQVESLKSQAITEAFSRVSASEAQGLTMLGEASSTVRSIQSILYRAVKIFAAVKKLDAKFLLKQISHKELQDRYMEARYALRPMMYDVVSVLKALETPPKNARSTFRSKRAQRFEASDEMATTTFGYFMKVNVKRTLTVDVEVRAGVLTDLSSTPFTIWGLDSVAESVWELTPFSFIVDWFFNVGKTIAAWTPNAGINELASWVTVKSTAVALNSADDVESTNAGYEHSNVFTWSGEKSRVTTAVDRFANPQRSVVPVLTVRLDMAKILDLAIILNKMR